jgi:hypothetical protein
LGIMAVEKNIELALVGAKEGLDIDGNPSAGF